MALSPMMKGLASKAIQHAPAIGAGVGAVGGALKKDDQGNRGGIGGAIGGAIAGGAAGYGAKRLAGKLSAPKSTPSARLAIENKPRVAPTPEVQSATGKKLAFATGFEKSAGAKEVLRNLTDTSRSPIAKGLGYAAGKGKATREAVGRGAARAAKGVGTAASEGFKKAYNPGNLPVKYQAPAPKKQSFIRRHPLASAVIGVGAYKALSSGSGNQQQQQPGPQVYQPSY